MKMHTITQYLFLAGFALNLNGCLKRNMPSSPGSDVKSLDNFARNPTTAAKEYSCGPNSMSASLTSSKIKNLVKGSDQDTVLMTLASVPTPLLNAFFDIGGTIELRADARQLCASKNLPELSAISGELPDYSACWVKNAKQPPVLYMVNDKVLIRAHLLRTLAYYYVSQPLEALKKDFPREVSNFQSKLSKLSNSFLAVLKARGLISLPKMQALQQKSPQLFEKMVFAEMVDSVYCSRDSYQAVAKPSSTFYPVFREFAYQSSGNISLGLELGSPWHGENQRR